MATIMTWIMSLFAWLVGVAMVALNYAMYYTVLNMGSYVKGLAAVGVTWRILRDLGNIVLIFGFLAVGITTILNVSWYGVKKMLPLLLIVAIFLNFSLFISEAVIDVGNLFATQFYQQINNGTLPTPATLNNGQGISDKIMSQFGLAQIYGGVTKTPNALLKGQPWYTGFLAIILFLVMTFVLFSLAFILIARFVFLLFLIIVAPIGFAGLIVPKLDNTAKKWWAALFEQTITAPVLLLLLYIALAIITDANFLTGFNGGVPGNGSWLGLSVSNLTGFAAVFLPFLVGTGLLLAVVIASKSMSAFGGATVMKFGQKAASGAASYAGRSTKRVGKYAWRRTGGRALYEAQQAALRSRFGQTKAGRLVATTLGKGGKSFKADKDKSIKAHEEYAKSVATAIDEKHAGAQAAAAQSRYSSGEEAKQAREEHDQLSKNLEVEKQKKDIEDLQKRVNENKASNRFPSPELNQRNADIKSLDEAKKRLAASEENLKPAVDRLAEAKKRLQNASGQEKAIGENIKREKQQAQLGYAQNARGAMSWIFGPGGAAAANNIVKNTLKKETELDSIKKILKDAEEAEKKTSEPDTKAATTAAAPPGGAAGGGKPA
jgi:hypothetical protein